MRLLLEAGPVALALDTSRRPSPPTVIQPTEVLPAAPMRTQEPDGSEMWVAHRQTVESWLLLAAERGPDAVAELMIEIDLQDVNG